MPKRNHGTQIMAEKYFNGDIIITDPCYSIPDDSRDDWQRCSHGADMFALGFRHYLCATTLIGDWYCEVFKGSGSRLWFPQVPEKKIGDFSAATYAKVFPAAIIILCSVAALLTLSNELDVLSLGDETAASLGLNTKAVRVIFLLLSALLAGSAVSVCGLLSFVGLLVPHAVKRIASREAKHSIPLCALFGASFVTFCDTLARVIFAPYELPVGIIMAFLGAPFFIFILIKGKGGHRNA